jgi:hypothetical protein
MHWFIGIFRLPRDFARKHATGVSYRLSDEIDAIEPLSGK